MEYQDLESVSMMTRQLIDSVSHRRDTVRVMIWVSRMGGVRGVNVLVLRRTSIEKFVVDLVGN